MSHALVLSCEHASRRVPSAYAQLFRSRAARRALSSHRGSDLGARTFARALARRFGAPLIEADATRLLVDCNRSASHPRAFSELSRSLSADQRALAIARYHAPHRARVWQAVTEALDAGHVAVHLGIHSFTPRLAGVTRNAEVGLLYDPAQPGEAAFSIALAAGLARAAPALRVRRNYPYRGSSDGLTTCLRRELRGRPYLGIELELNQGLLARGAGARSRLLEAVALSLREALATR